MPSLAEEQDTMPVHWYLWFLLFREWTGWSHLDRAHRWPIHGPHAGPRCPGRSPDRSRSQGTRSPAVAHHISDG